MKCQLHEVEMVRTPPEDVDEVRRQWGKHYHCPAKDCVSSMFVPNEAYKQWRAEMEAWWATEPARRAAAAAAPVQAPLEFDEP